MKRTYGTESGSSRQASRRQNTTLLLAGTAFLSATSGYLLAAYEHQKPEAHGSGIGNAQYGTAKDFCNATEELKAAFPEPGAVSDDPKVLEPYGFSENDYHPGIFAPSAKLIRAESLRI